MRGWGGGAIGLGFGLEAFEREEGAVAGAAGGIDAVLEFGEGVGVAGGGLTEGELLFIAESILILVAIGLGFGIVEAAEAPLAANDVVDVETFDEVGGAEVAVALLGEMLKLGGTFERKDEGFGVEAGFEAVHGGGGLACDRGGAGGFLGVAAVGFYLTESRHWDSGFSEAGSGGQSGRPVLV
jgi:hypothetical protein